MSWITDPKFLVGIAIGFLVVPRLTKLPVLDKLRGLGSGA